MQELTRMLDREEPPEDEGSWQLLAKEAGDDV